MSDLVGNHKDGFSCDTAHFYLHRLDLELYKVSMLSKQSSEWESYLCEITGQFFFLIGTLLLKRAAKVGVLGLFFKHAFEQQ